MFVTFAGCDIKVWDGKTGVTEMNMDNVTPAEISACCLDNNGRNFVYGTYEGHIRICQFMTGRPMASYNRYDAFPQSEVVHFTTNIRGLW